MKKKSLIAFTLVELLIIMSIIGILSTFGFTNYITSIKKARDAERKSDLRQIQKALELFKLDQNPVAYPVTGTLPAPNNCWSSGAGCTGNIYMNNMLGDGSTAYNYTRNPSDSLKYTLIACLENSSDPEGTSCASCTSPKVCYTVSEP